MRIPGSECRTRGPLRTHVQSIVGADKTASDLEALVRSLLVKLEGSDVPYDTFPAKEFGMIYDRTHGRPALYTPNDVAACKDDIVETIRKVLSPRGDLASPNQADWQEHFWSCAAVSPVEELLEVRRRWGPAGLSTRSPRVGPMGERSHQAL
ncbi:FAD binding domain-containing protein [Apiospora saccharicola]|uniref:FAD binding domain-containing protein n=1 Tax=Apiospora saccharicola TaxID=335842 RepID=A0ABR1TN07_9PEZI